ncbi:signal recognition particle receptor beta subunit-domain-containing protein [Syncephalastrum racemosum]|uniref:Signal recognition particle receptor subunit beta n=1 Tax=Syncephalastrum racemosum TaxID=13706 RepID=A0A1X2H9P0_SYNRA|nr:signal recognition particle receptor beta subunit-domain-containing protein [Syncephalastrum racemosum]
MAMDQYLNHPYLVPIVGSIVLVLVLISLAFVFLKQKPRQTTLLILGTTDAGKTSLFTQLYHGQTRPTVTSMKENEGTFEAHNKKYDLVDVPGHQRLRYRYTDYLPVTRAIIFVVDSTTLARQVRFVAEYLYDVLAQKQVQSNHIPVLVACNKCDLITALPKEKIQQRLEEEINRLRTTRTAALEQQASEGDEEQEAYLGYEGEPFKFEHLENVVHFETLSARKSVTELENWILEL